MGSLNQQLLYGLLGEIECDLVSASKNLPAAFNERYGMDVILRDLDRFIVGLAVNLDDYVKAGYGEVCNVAKPGEQHLRSVGDSQSSDGSFEGEFGGGSIGVKKMGVTK